MKKRAFLMVALFVNCMLSFGQTFTTGGINYAVTSSTLFTVEVSQQPSTYTGTANIPANVIYNGQTYAVTSIGNEAFSECRNLTAVTIPNSITIIGAFAFYYCTNLPSIELPNSIEYLDDYAFSSCESLGSIVIPNSVTGLGIAVFAGDTNLTSITIPNSISYISEGCFVGTGISSIVIPDSVTSIGVFAFAGCTSLTSVTIPNSVTHIRDGAFIWCENLQSITIPNSVTIIEEYAFEDCFALRSVTVDFNTPLSIVSSVFEGLTLSNIALSVPAGTVSLYEAAPVWTDFNPITAITLSNNSFEQLAKIEVYPNPAPGVFNLNVSDNLTVEVFDYAGKQITSRKINAGSSSIDLSNISNGNYLLKATQNEQAQTIKIIKN